jgi:hypothetical protein
MSIALPLRIKQFEFDATNFEETYGRSLYKYVMWISFRAASIHHFHPPLLSTTFHRKLVGNPSLCRFVFSFFIANIEQDTCTGVLSGWEKAESRRKRRLR